MLFLILAHCLYQQRITSSLLTRGYYMGKYSHYLQRNRSKMVPMHKSKRGGAWVAQLIE